MKRIRCFVTAFVFLTLIFGVASAQEPILEWKYKAGSGFCDLSMSPNGRYIVVRVLFWPDDNPERGYSEVHLLNESGQLLWKRSQEPPDLIIEGIAVSDNGFVALASSAGPFGRPVKGKWQHFNFVSLINPAGDIQWRKDLKNSTIEDVSISPDGGYVFFPFRDYPESDNHLRLLDHRGKKVWSQKHSGENGYALWMRVPLISQDASTIVVYEHYGEVFYVFDERGRQLWRRECPFYEAVRLCPSGKWIATLDKEPIEGAVGEDAFFKELRLLSRDGQSELDGGIVPRNWFDFAVTDDGIIVVAAEDDLSGDKFIFWRDPTSPESAKMSYHFELPRGKQVGGCISVEVSANGNAIAVSTPYEIHFLRLEELEKKW